MLRTSPKVISTAVFLTICGFATVCVFGLPQTSSPQDLTGTVLDGKTPLGGARVLVTLSGTSKVDETVTDAHGKFSLVTAKTGACLLRVHKDGYRDSEVPVSLPLASARPLKISLTQAPPSTQSDQGIEFSDQPDFTVAGITDWTAAGGHGSDVNLRASESLARDTRALSSVTPSVKIRDSELERRLRAEVVKDPASFEANHALGKFCLQQRQFVNAIAPLEKAHKLNAGDFENSYQLAQAYDGAGRYTEAKTAVTELLARSDRAELHRLLGGIEEQLSNPLASEREYERAVQLDASEENYFVWGGELLIHRAIEAAIDVFTKGAKAFPRSERMLAGLGAALYAHGSYEQGAQRVCDASDLNPSDPQPYLFLGKMEQASPRPLPCVMEKLARFVHEQPNNARSNYDYAMALLKSNDDEAGVEKAEELLANAVRLDPNFALAYLQLGILKSKDGDWKGAKESYEKAAARDPALPDPHFRLAQVYQRMGDPQNATRELRIFDSLKKSDAASVEQRRREIQQFVVVMKDTPAQPAN